MLYTSFTVSQQNLYTLPSSQGGQSGQSQPGAGNSNGNVGNGQYPSAQAQPQPQFQFSMSPNMFANAQQNIQQPPTALTPNLPGGTQMPQPQSQGGTMVLQPPGMSGNPFAAMPQPSPYQTQGVVQPASSLPGGMAGTGSPVGGSGLEKMMSMMMMVMMCLMQKLGLTGSDHEVDLTGEGDEIDPADKVNDPKDKIVDPDHKTDEDTKTRDKKKDKIKAGEPGEIKPGDESAYDDLIAKYAKKYDVDPKLIKAIIRQSSDFDAGAVSKSGRHGLMQLSESAAKSYGFEGSIEDLYDPETNISFGAKRIKKLLEQKKENVKDALVAYFGGSKAGLDTKPKGETLTSGEYATLVQGWLADLKAGKKLDTKLDAKPISKPETEKKETAA